MAFEKDYWAKMLKEVLDEYNRPSGSPKIIDVDSDMYNRIKESHNGIWFRQMDYSKLLREMRAM